MGLFLSLSGVIGKSKIEVEHSLREYLISKSGGLESKKLNHLHHNRCILSKGKNGTTVFYPYGFLDWDNSSAFLSQRLNASSMSLLEKHKFDLIHGKEDEHNVDNVIYELKRTDYIS